MARPNRYDQKLPFSVYVVYVYASNTKALTNQRIAPIAVQMLLYHLLVDKNHEKHLILKLPIRIKTILAICSVT